jgi:hypothetical protein
VRQAHLAQRCVGYFSDILTINQHLPAGGYARR